MSYTLTRRSMLASTAGLSAVTLLQGCGGGSKSTEQATTVVDWVDIALQAIRDTKPGPPQCARHLAIVCTAMYDAWSAYDPVALRSTFKQSTLLLRRPSRERTAANKNKAICIAAYLACVDQFPTEKAKFDEALAESGYSLADATSTDLTTPAGIAVRATKDLLSFRHADGSNQLGLLTPSGVPYADYTGYVPQDPPMVVTQPTPLSDIPNPERWQRLTYFDAQGTAKTPEYIAPHWGKVTPFALTSATQFRPKPPKALKDANGNLSAEFVAQAQQVIDIQINLTEEQKIIAEYWADGPSSELPPGHWCLFAKHVSARDRHNNDTDVRMFFALTNAILDASIACWEAKRFYDYARPISAIRYLFNGQLITGVGPMGPAAPLTQVLGEAWRTFQVDTFPTPPFPEYTSGHSTYSAASAEVLKLFTGSDAFGGSHTQPARSLRIDNKLPTKNMTLSWSTFSEAAEQAGMSRLYGGIHFMDGNVEGLDMGRKIGQRAYIEAVGYWSGNAGVCAPGTPEDSCARSIPDAPRRQPTEPTREEILTKPAA